MPQPKPLTSSGYDRVKQILNSVQGDSIPDYQGYRAFWESLDVFLTIELYGQRMIAPPDSGGGSVGPPDAKGCCNKKDNSNSSAGESAVAAVNPQPTNSVDADCWPNGGQGGGGADDDSGIKRSDRSGIIKGLRGEYPFDGSIFPPLLWDAARQATTAEIRIIADWIDAGCPAESGPETTEATEGKQQALTARRNEKLALASGSKLHSVSKRCANVDRQAVKGLKVRKEVSTLTPTELARLRDALSCMYRYNPYWQDERSFDHWARIHTNSCQHGWEQFLPWHRLYLYFFEQTLQDYDSNITLPYWSWADYYQANETTFDNSQLDLGIIPEAYRCWLTGKGLQVLKDTPSDGGGPLFNEQEIEQLSQVADNGVTYNSGLRFLKAAKIPYSLIKDPQTQTAAWSQKIRAIYSVLRDINPLWFPNRWPGSTSASTSDPTIPTSYPNKGNIKNVLALTNWPDFGGGPEYDHHFGALEQVHNGMHNFAGGANPCYPYTGNTPWIDTYKALGIPVADQQNKENPPMGWMTDNRITAFDPIFWAHHANVDRLWSRWQELHPGAAPEELDAGLAPWPMTVKDSLSIKKLGYEYMRDTFHYATANDVAITHFKGESVGVGQDVLDTHRKVEVRLHRLQRGNMHNANIRIFLNQPDADIHTPTENNPNFVGEVATFHGTCYGGPGHCALPLERSRSSDLRSLHHHEPRNFRIDATQAVNQLLAAGCNDLSVQLVVTGVDGAAKDSALYMEAVSLNFFD